MLAHCCFFSLHDNSPAAVKKLIDACKKYLPDHPGVIYFAVGTLNRELDRPVNDRDFDVSLTMIFDSKAAHDAYQVAPDAPAVHPREQTQLAPGASF